MKHKEPKVTKSILKRKKKKKAMLEDLHYLILRLNYKYTVTNTGWYWFKDRHIDKWKTIQVPEVGPYYPFSWFLIKIPM